MHRRTLARRRGGVRLGGRDARACRQQAAAELPSVGFRIAMQIADAFVSVSIACLDDLPDEDLAALPVRYSDGRADAWGNEPRVMSYL